MRSCAQLFHVQTLEQDADGMAYANPAVGRAGAGIAMALPMQVSFDSPCIPPPFSSSPALCLSIPLDEFVLASADPGHGRRILHCGTRVQLRQCRAVSFLPPLTGCGMLPPISRRPLPLLTPSPISSHQHGFHSRVDSDNFFPHSAVSAWASYDHMVPSLDVTCNMPLKNVTCIHPNTCT